MRDMKELKNAFGQADDVFVNNVYHTLTDIQSNKDRKPVKKTYFRLAGVIAIVCILCAGTALAFNNTWGILDFLSGRRADVKVLPEASDIVQKDISQKGSQTEFAAFTVREAVFDGQNIYIVVDVVPSGSDYLLLGPDAYPYDPSKNLGPLFSGKTGTIADYARESNKEMMQTSVGISGSNCSIDYLLEEDGTLVCMISSRFTGDSNVTDVELECVAVPFVIENGKYTRDMDRRKDTTLSATLKNTGTQGTVASKEPAVFRDGGVRVDKITLKSSAMSTYAEIEFTVIDAEKYAETDGILFEFLDIYGERIPSGAASGGGIESIDDMHYIEKVSLQAMEKLPSEVILRGYSYLDKNRYETHTFGMK
ncbi:hypothetical protein [Pseudobacteroides cellulosolvens]|uniref:DUF4179 domain-containing protein n=1 Tax=Pseudobacteroides cellulosolvens ATCC 35603 = DSM 2933 TaxID=398512 RepID=A0A0L6JWW5_9FIRM|nr:hypothetical protein [Pseudobacteroides cellulosolvens]KNY30100.1 hypothetical protein Bccel_5377 [Pseudobacteroides cellulosolvens ATCC 35603 = DSM 2933]